MHTSDVPDLGFYLLLLTHYEVNNSSARDRVIGELVQTGFPVATQPITAQTWP
jgi:hypothetical protein